MKYEFHSQYPFVLQDGTIQAFAIDWLAGKADRLPRTWQEITSITDPMQRVLLLSQAIVTDYKDQARVGTRREKGGYLLWLKREAPNFLQRQREAMQAIGLEQTPLPDLTLFPTGTWALRFTFTLRTSYLSRDDVDFYILDNPVKKEYVFKVPYIAPSQWKGALRSAMMRDLVFALQEGRVDESRFVADRLRLYRLFGNEKDGTAEFLDRAWALHRVGPRPDTEDAEQRNAWEQRFQAARKDVSEEFEQLVRDRGYRVGNVEGFQGRLRFYPTYFDRLGLEVINPHPRDTGAGKQPIYFESVPPETTGRFVLLYVPFDRIGEDEAETRKQAAEDLTLVAQGLQAMFTLYGFGAKTSSGFGLAEDSLVEQGSLTLHMEDTEQPQEEEAQPEDPMQALQADIDAFLQRFGVESFPRWTNQELRASGWGKKRQSEYKKLRSRHPDWDAQTGRWRETAPVEPAEEAAPEPPLTERAFTSFSELVALSASLATKLTAGGAG